MEGRCRRCGEKLSLLQRLQGQDFCSPEHKSEFQREQEEMALARLQQTATTLRQVEYGKPPGRGGLRDSSGSRSAIEAKREIEPPLGSFLEDWTSTANIAPLPPELTEEELECGMRLAKFAASLPLAACITPLEPLELQPNIGDTITILSPRASSVTPAPGPVLPAGAVTLEPFGWQAASIALEGEPAYAGLLPPGRLEGRVHEPIVRWLEPFEVDFPMGPPVLRGSGTVAATALCPDLASEPFALDGLVEALSRPATLHPGEEPEVAAERARFGSEDREYRVDAATELALAPPVRGEVRFGFRRLKRHRVAVAPEETVPAPSIACAGPGIRKASVDGLVASSRRLPAKAAPARNAALPHFAAIPVPVRPQGYGYAPDLTPVAILTACLAAPLPLEAPPFQTVAATFSRGISEAEPAPIQPRAGSWAGVLAGDAQDWAVPPSAPLVSLHWSHASHTAAIPSIVMMKEEFSHGPRVIARTTSLRAVVPPRKSRIKMEVRLEPPVPAPWFEPMTCAFGGDPYGSR